MFFICISFVKKNVMGNFGSVVIWPSKLSHIHAMFILNLVMQGVSRIHLCGWDNFLQVPKVSEFVSVKKNTRDTVNMT